MADPTPDVTRVPTPYDEDRGAYSRAALARLVLSDWARGHSETAAELVATRYDAYCGPGGRVSEARQLAQGAEGLLTRAVVYERERGSSWEDIARCLGIEAAAAEQRYTPAIERWSTAFDVPYRLDPTGCKRIPQLPTAAYDPRSAVRALDHWAHSRLVSEDKHAVSAGLDAPADGPDHPERHEIEGRIRRENLGALMRLLAQYIGHYTYGTDWALVASGVKSTDEQGLDSWDCHFLAGVSHTLDVRLANIPDDDEALAVVIGGAGAADLRLRIDTLLAALSAAG